MAMLRMGPARAAFAGLLCISGLAYAGCANSQSEFALDHAAALEHAARYASETMGARRIGDILIEPSAAGYSIRLIELPAPDQPVYTFHMEVDGQTGTPRDQSRAHTETYPYDAATATLAGTLLGARDAHQAALNAVTGYEHFDDKGTVSVVLLNGDYVVTLPLPAEQRSGTRGGDFAYRIWVDGMTGEIIKILTSS